MKPGDLLKIYKPSYRLKILDFNHHAYQVGDIAIFIEYTTINGVLRVLTKFGVNFIDMNIVKS